MAYQIVFSKLIRQQIQRLPNHVKAIAKQQIAQLSQNPRLPDSKELAGHADYYRSWLGSNHRLVWHLCEEDKIVEIEYVGPKFPDLYAYLGLGRNESK